MRKMKKKRLLILLLAMIVLSVSACKNGEKETIKTEDVSKQNQESKEEVKEATPTPEPPRDLGGITIEFADWWSTGEETEPANQREEDQQAYRNEIQEKHNFTLKSKNLGTWGEYQEIFITSTISGSPAASIFAMDQKFCPEPLKQGLFYPVSDLPSFDFNDKRWNKSISDYMTQNEKVYGFSEEQNGPGLGIFFNKRLFEEVGLDPDLLYDLQKSGEWKWDKLEEVSRKLTQDKNGDSITDIYAICAWQVEVVKAAVFSNGSDYVRFNETTKRYENNQMADGFLDAVNLGVDFYNRGYIMPDPEGAEFTWFENAFKTGQAAMCVTEWYRNSAFQEMEDDWGFVFFPAGPKGEMRTMYTGNVRVMPAGLDAQLADDIAFAYSLWVATVPGYEDLENDYSYYASLVRDDRTINETLIPMIEGQGVRSLLYQVPGLSFKYGSNMEGGGLGAMSAIEIAETASAAYDGIIEEFYSK